MTHTLSDSLHSFRRMARRKTRDAQRRAEVDAVLRETHRRTVANAFADLANEHRDNGTFSIADLLAECGEPATTHREIVADVLARAQETGTIVVTGDSVLVLDSEEAIGVAYRGLS